MSRKAAREHAFKIVYELPFYQGLEQENVTVLTDSYMRDFVEESLDEADTAFIQAETLGVQQKQEELDEAIGAALKGWKVSRLSRVDLAILRLAAYEILYMPSLPVKVSITEAVELAKRYSQEAAPAFINGILGTIALKRTDEDEEL